MTEADRAHKMPRLSSPHQRDLVLTLDQFETDNQNISTILSRIRSASRVSVADPQFEMEKSKTLSCLKGLECVLSQCSAEDLMLFVSFSLSSSLSPGKPGLAVFSNVCKMTNLQTLRFPQFQEGESFRCGIQQTILTAKWPNLRKLVLGSFINSREREQSWKARGLSVPVTSAAMQERALWDLGVLQTFNASCTVLEGRRFLPSLVSLELGGDIGSEGLHQLTSVLSYVPQLENLCMSAARRILCTGPIFSKRSEDFFSKLGTMSNLHTLGVCMAKLSKKDISTCMEKLRSGTAPISELDLPPLSVNADTLSVMSFPKTLKSLALPVNNLSSCPMGVPLDSVAGSSLNVFFQTLGTSCMQLQSLALPYCCLHWHGFEGLLVFLRVFHGMGGKLLNLDVGHNYMDKRDAENLAEGLGFATSLTSLYAQHHPECTDGDYGDLQFEKDFTVDFEEEDGEYASTVLGVLWERLKCLTKLERLKISVSSNDLDTVADFSKNLPGLTALMVYGTELIDDGEDLLRKALDDSRIQWIRVV